MKYSDQRTRRVRDIINDSCIVRVPSGSKELPALEGSGYYTWQFYLRRALLDPLCLQVICDDFWNKNEELFKARPFQITGVESAAIPLITAIILDGHRRGHALSGFTIRKTRKAYGMRNIIEGAPTEQPVLLIDDLTSPQHNSFWHAINIIGSAGLTLAGRAYVLVLKKPADQSRTIATSLAKVTVDSLFTLSDFALTLEEYESEKAQPTKRTVEAAL